MEDLSPVVFWVSVVAIIGFGVWIAWYLLEGFRDHDDDDPEF